MILNGIDYPNQIITELNDNKLVIFAGAGVSMGKPTNLPDFDKLTDQIAEGSVLKRKKGEPCDEFMGRLEDSGIPVKEEVARLLSDSCIEPNDLHEAIVNVFKHDVRIVTTNYDHMFEKVTDSDIKVFNAPALPLGNDVRGIVHIHGNTDDPQYMVVTDKDFGKAYLAYSYVSHFVKELFYSYTVVFIGYSYKDTIMRYLTRALSRDNKQKRYIITTDKKSDWKKLGITPIFYPKNAHRMMRESLEKLGIRVRRDLSDWSEYFSEIAEAPPMDQTIESEIDFCLEDETKTQVFANSINGTTEWIDYLERKQVFKTIFANNNTCDNRNQIWINWIAEKVIGKTDESFKRLVLRNGRLIPLNLAKAIIRILSSDSSISDKSFSEYLLMVESYINDQYTIYALIEKAYGRNDYSSCLILFKRYWTISFQLANGSWTTKNAFPDYAHHFLGESHFIEDSWEKCKGFLLSSYAKNLLCHFRSKLEELHTDYVRVGKADSNKEPWDMAMLVIEDRKKNYHEDPLISMVKILEELINSSNLDCEFASTYLKDGLYSESIFVRKVFIKLLRTCECLDNNTIFDLLHVNNLLGLIEAKEQVFLLIHKIYPGLSNKNKNILFNYIERVNEVHNCSSEYEKYNWCVWIQRVDPDNKRITSMMKDILSRNQFKPRKHPELFMYDISVGWEDDDLIAPTYKGNLVTIDFEELIRVLKSDKPGIQSIRHHRQMDVFSDCISENYYWAKSIAKKLLDVEEYGDEIWQYYLQGVINSSFSANELAELLVMLYEPLSFRGFQKDISELLWKTVQEDNVNAYFEKNNLDIIEICQTIWNHRGSEKGSLDRTIDLALNTTIGLVLMSIMYVVSFDSELHLNDRIKDFFQKSLALKGWERDISVCVIAGHFSFLFYRDSKWCSDNLIPLLTAKRRASFLPAWEGFIYFSKRLNRNVADTLSTVFLNAVKHIKWLSGEALQGFIDMYLALLIYVVKNPIARYIPAYYTNATIADRRTFVRGIGHRIKMMTEEAVELWWDSWLKRYLTNLMSGRPSKPCQEELLEIIYWLPAFKKHFDEIVLLLTKVDLPDNVDNHFLYSLEESNIVHSSPNSTIRLVTMLLNAGNKFEHFQDYLKNIVSKASCVDETIMHEFREALLRQNILLKQ